MLKFKHITFLIILMLLSASILFSQGRLYEGPDDPAGDVAAEREGYMTGNRVFLYFQNNCELSDWPREDVSKWPNDYTGVKMTDGINILITAQVFIENDSIPVTDPVRIASEKLDTLWYCETSFRGGMDLDPTGTVEWGLYPVFGYFNENSEYPAMSNLPISWPTDGWPAQGTTKKWAGEWNGRFGLGVLYADLETYFVCNDAHDQEYLEATDDIKYYPRGDLKIGDKNPAVTIQAGKPWGGLGVRVETRGYQWNNPLARDAIFFEYNITNVSDYDLPQMAFGYHVDNAIGNDSNDEIGYFDKLIDMAFSWDIDGVGRGSLPTGTMGFAYLESPGLAYDGIDNDDDGIIDEKRDNAVAPGEEMVEATHGIYDFDKFERAYGISPDELVPHFAADEDQDWKDGDDKNGDGIYQVDENPGDDVGLDGIGPAELNYPGPDEGECNHRPDFVEGLGCEPNFAATDVTESDMLGLTSFNMFEVTQQLNGQPSTFHADWVMWQYTGTGREALWDGGISNLIEVFGSGPFPLYKGRTERVSMSTLHSYDELSGLQQDVPEAPVLFKLKSVVQLIYEKDYRFAQPPKMPTLTATPGDGKVVLTWDDTADKHSREPFLGGANDFEGYRLYRATDKKFQDAQRITDGTGTPTFYKPIFQCDLKDNITGYTDYGLLNGMGYNLGTDTGIQHFFIDENVENGKTYYYGLVAFDYGIHDSVATPGIAPSENNLVIELDEFENVRYIGKNIQIVTPRTTAPGYVPPSIEIVKSSFKETSGSVVPQIVSKNALQVDHTYMFKPRVDTLQSQSKDPNYLNFVANGYEIWDITDSAKVVAWEDPTKYSGNIIVNSDIYPSDEDNDTKEDHLLVGSPFETDVADGISCVVTSSVLNSRESGFDYINSGWSVGNALIQVAETEDVTKFFPWDYELIFTNDPEAYTMPGKAPSALRDLSGEKYDKSVIIDQETFSFFMINKTFPTVEGQYDTLGCLVHDVNLNGAIDMLEDEFIFGSMDNRDKWFKSLFHVTFMEEPEPNDVYFATFNRPFFTTDSLLFKILPEGDLETDKIKDQMEKIKVVPNPYVASNTMEPVVGNWLLNQRRRIMFTHLPAQCDIKIFTMSGVLVDEINVDNPADEGIAHWDLRSSEDLEIAAGMYIYHVKAREVDAEKIGKFAVIK